MPCLPGSIIKFKVATDPFRNLLSFFSPFVIECGGEGHGTIYIHSVVLDTYKQTSLKKARILAVGNKVNIIWNSN